MTNKKIHDINLIQSDNKRLATSVVLRTLWKTALHTALISFVLAVAPAIQAQSCDNIPVGGGQSISAQITIDGTGTLLTDQAVVPASTRVRIDSIASASGECIGMAEYCNGGCSCISTGYVYNRNINHIEVRYDASTSGALNGNYSLGSVFGKNPDGTTAFWNVLDTQASNSTGPKYMTLSSPGTYQFHIKAIINPTPCFMEPGETETINITIYVGDKEGSANFGGTPCEGAVGKPINVTNGNMYIKQTDYRLPGFGEGLEVTRTYNSKMQRAGIFGFGWSTAFDESINAYGATFLRLNLPDGRAVYLSR